MGNALADHIKRFISLDPAEEEIVGSFLAHQSIKKKTFLLKEGQTCYSNYFVEKGCLRMFFIDEKGVEHTSQFAIENWWITDLLSYDQQKAAQFYIQAVEKAEVVSITKTAQEEMLARLPKLERYFRMVIQKSYGASQVRIKYLFSQSGEERYHHFNNLFPEFVQRVPQYMLASYLGFTPEFLSKIRAGKL